MTSVELCQVLENELCPRITASLNEQTAFADLPKLNDCIAH
jgi:hypothetical protein